MKDSFVLDIIIPQLVLFEQLRKKDKLVTWGIFACGIFLDSKKASDTANHDTLLKKLEYYVIRGIINSLSQSDLNDRIQFTTVNK